MEKKVLSKEELIDRLKELSVDESERPEMMNVAMCYSIAPPSVKHTTCDKCGADIEYWD